MTLLSACGDTTGAGKGPDSETFTPGGTLYVANAGDGRLLAFDAPIKGEKNVQSKIIPIVAEGNISPSRQFPDTVSGPTGLFLDRANDVLYVANSDQNAIQIYENASTLTAPLAATRVIAGSETLLDRPYDVAYDSTEARLYVVNRGANSIVAFDSDCLSGSALSGNIAPCRLILGPDTELDFPRSLTVDPVKNRLYVSNTGNDAILAFASASEAGGSPASCVTNFDDCNEKAEFLLFAHDLVDGAGIPVQLEKKLEFPFGIRVDSTNDRLYVANSGLNTPGILIYESISTLFSALSDEAKAMLGGNRLNAVPERVISGLSTQLTVPAGLDFDPANGNLVVVNNNSPNNVNSSTGSNDDSPSLLVFEGLETSCPTSSIEACNLAPNRRIGGDVSADIGTTLASPVGVAYDSARDDAFYVANTGANNILIYSSALEGDLAPLKDFSGDKTYFDIPSAFFYDVALDRLYVANAGSLPEGTSSSSTSYPVLVYDNFSDLTPGNKEPSWALCCQSQMERIVGLHLDKTRNRLIVLSGANPSLRYGIVVFDLADRFTDPTNPSVAFPFPTNDATGPILSDFSNPGGLTPGNFPQLSTPGREGRTTDGLSAKGPSSMAVREVLSGSDKRGEIYVTDQVNHTVVVYALPAEDSLDSGTYTLSGSLTKLRTIDGLNSPSGVYLDTQRDILYVTNNGEAPGATADYKSNTIFVYENALSQGNGFEADGSTAVSCAASPCRPTRIISTAALSSGTIKKLKAPISPYVDMTNDRLLVINAGSGQNAIFTFEEASTLGDSVCVDGNGSCTNVLPSKVLSGSDTTLSFSTDSTKDFVGALLVTGAKNSPTVHVGQSVDPDCESSCFDGSILVFGVSGKTVPLKVWTAGGGGLSAPGAMALDVGKNILYVANQGDNSLARFSDIAELDVTVTTSAAKTDLTGLGLNQPAGLAVDPDLDRLYVSNAANDRILVFNGASTLSNSAAPSETITSGLNGPEGLTLNLAKKRLYVANTKADEVLVFDLEDTTTPIRTFRGTNTKISHPSAVAVDRARDLLYVLNQRRGEVLVFENASELSGDIAPSRVIFPASIGTVAEITGDLSLTLASPYEGDSQSRLPVGLDSVSSSLQGHVSVVNGSTFIAGDGTVFDSDLKVGDLIRIGRAELTNPSALFLDDRLDVLYLADRGSHTVYIFPEASTAEGTASHKKLKENLTLLSSPSALAVNTN